MSADELATVEAEFKLSLPHYYSDFMLNYPRPLVENKMDLRWIREAPADRQFRNDPARLIELNHHVRLPGTPRVGDEGEPWPYYYFVIGDDQCGNYWCVDTRTADPGVWFYDHDRGDFRRQHTDLASFAESLLARIEEYNWDPRKP